MTMSVDSGQWAVSRKQSAIRRRAITLVELLVAIAIISILATLLLGVASRAGRTAREARTKSIISRLHTLVTERAEEYRSIRAELNTRTLQSAPEPDWAYYLRTEDPTQRYSQLSLQEREPLGRLFALRERQRLEMPDRWSDVACGPIAGPTLPNPSVPPENASQYAYWPRYVSERPPLNLLYYRQLIDLYSRTNTITQLPNTEADILTNQSAECLYLTVMNATADGEARGLFKESDTGDTDGDGALEFLDAWGNPIGWIRWPAGYESDLQWSFTRLVDLSENPPQGETGLDAVQQVFDENHDPFDLFRVDRVDVNDTDPPYVAATGEGGRGWKLVPLIYSAGLDEELGLANGIEIVQPNVNFEYVATNSDPYWGTPEGSRNLLPLGTVTDREAATDNITNHVIEAR